MEIKDQESFDEGVKVATQMIRDQAFFMIDDRRRWVKKRKPLGYIFRLEELNRMFTQFMSELVK